MKNKKSEESLFKVFNCDVSCYIEVEKRKLINNEPIFVYFCLENHSNRTIKYCIGGDNRNFLGRSLSFKVSLIKDGTGQKIEDSHPNITNFGGRSYFHSLEASGSEKSRNRESLFLPDFVFLNESGKFFLSISKSVEFENTNGNRTKKEVVTKSIGIEILRYNNKDIVEYLKTEIRKFEDIREKNYDETIIVMRKLVNFSPHPFLLDFFLEYALKMKYSHHLHYFLRALEKYKCEEAISKGILSVYDVKFEQIRMRCTTDELAETSILGHQHAVICSIVNSVSPYAVDYLVKFGTHPYSAVRNAIINCLSKNKRFICFDNVFSKLEDDENDWIREVSRKYVKNHPITIMRNQMVKCWSFRDIVVVCQIK